MNLNTQTLPSTDPERRIQCLLVHDEFAAMGRLGVVSSAAAFLAGYDLRLLTVVQAMSQAQAHSIDAWSYFQAKSTKQSLAEVSRDLAPEDKKAIYQGKVDRYEKESARDFALWKAAKPEDEATGAAIVPPGETSTAAGVADAGEPQDGVQPDQHGDECHPAADEPCRGTQRPLPQRPVGTFHRRCEPAGARPASRAATRSSARTPRHPPASPGAPTAGRGAPSPPR